MGGELWVGSAFFVAKLEPHYISCAFFYALKNENISHFNIKRATFLVTKCAKLVCNPIQLKPGTEKKNNMENNLPAGGNKAFKQTDKNWVEEMKQSQAHRLKNIAFCGLFVCCNGLNVSCANKLSIIPK